MARSFALLLILTGSLCANAIETCAALLEKNLLLVDRVAAEITSFDSIDAVEAVIGEMRGLDADIQSLQRPVAHGTTSHFLPTILSEGLNPSSSQYIAVSDLRRPEGMMTSYGNAVHTLSPRYKVSSYELTGRDIIDRLADHNQWLSTGAFSFIRKMRLRFMARVSTYERKFAGFPVILIYDAAKLNDLSISDKKLPAGLLSRSHLDVEDLNYIFTPAENTEELSQMLEQFSISFVRIVPLEFLEICDIAAHPTHPLRALVKKCLP